MTITDRLLSLVGLERRAHRPASCQSGFDSYWRDFSALRGCSVTPESAEGVSAVYACVDAISSTIASLPLHLFRKTDDVREKAPEHPLYRVLHDQPNPRQTALEFRELMCAHMLLRGNAYAKVVRGADGQVRELWPLHPDRLRLIGLPNDRLAYEHTTRDGQVQRLTEDDCFVLRHRSDDGITGISPIARARGAIELALSEQQMGVDTFRNGARLTGILKFDGTVQEEDYHRIRSGWRRNHDSGDIAVIDGGLDFKPISMTLEDAEWIAARQFSVEEVCRLFRVPPTIVGDLRHGNYSNTSELFRQFVTLSLRRHLVAWEQSIHRQLLSEVGRRTYFVEHSVEGVLRGDSKARSDFYHNALVDGWMTVDEVRRLENLPARQEPQA